MRVAILGSWREHVRQYRLREDRAQFSAACEEIGRELARRGQIAIVGGESENTADHHVVNGMIRVLGGSAERPVIEVIRPEHDRSAYRSFAQKYPKLFSFPPRLNRAWGEAHLLQLKDADAVVTIGGMEGTYLAGLAAVVAKKTVVPIGSFGGGSEKLLPIVSEDRKEIQSELNVLAGPWTAVTLEMTIRLLGVNRQSRLLIIHGRSIDRYVLTEWLRTKLGLADVLVMQDEFGGGRTLPEKFESIANQVDGAIAVATPDDFGGPATSSDPQARARQNVWIEIGWIWGRLGRDKVMLLCKGAVEVPSDLQGMEYQTYSGSPLEGSEDLSNAPKMSFFRHGKSIDPIPEAGTSGESAP